ncbi:DUF1848 domain-containing protein [bacterium 1XD8-76]|nr:DUF1848 domain-containing protein [bacterium 1XD8-76]
MILSVSRRTDIPNYYADWFCNRIREGFLYVRNPMNAHQISRIELSTEVVDCIVFWTKNPAGMMERLEELKDYSYYFQFTLTGYGRDVEPNLPDKREVLIPRFRELSEKIGNRRVVWRYDPILINEKYTVEYHLKAFEEIAESLAGYTKRVVISFLDYYAKTQRNMAGLQVKSFSDQEMLYLAEHVAKIAAKHDMAVESCAERVDLRSVGVEHGSCIDKRRIEEIIGCRLVVKKDKNQRRECGCVESVETGAYNTCGNGCRYCYANFSDEAVNTNQKACDPTSPLLCGIVHPEDRITERKVKSLKDTQMSLF